MGSSGQVRRFSANPLPSCEQILDTLGPGFLLDGEDTVLHSSILEAGKHYTLNKEVTTGFVGNWGRRGYGANNVDVLAPRTQLCHSILNLALARKCLIIKAPRYTGKTSMLQLLRNSALREKEQFGKVYLFNAVIVTETNPFEEAWERAFGSTWQEACSLASSPKGQEEEGSMGQKQQKIPLVLVDDAQVLYNQEGTRSSAFWAVVKALSTHRREPMADGTAQELPTDPDDKKLPEGNMQPCLRLLPAEIDDYFARYCKHLGWQPADLVGLKDFLALRSDCQPGLFSILLSKMASFEFSNSSSLMDAKKAFLSHMGYHAIATIPEYAEVMRKLCDSCYEARLEVFTEAETVPLFDFVRTGQLVLKGEETVQFASTLHAEFFLSTDRSPSRSLENYTLPQFLRELVLPGMSATRLMQSGCTALYPFDCSLSPDAGALFGVQGFLDFLLLPKGWGFAVLTEGSRIDGYQERPERGERYQELFDLGIMQDAAIIDFRVHNLILEATPENGRFYYVVLGKEKDFKEATLRHAQTGEEWPIKLAP
ncbi:hypothetical protein COCOBI_03-1900 [Coccomyxa sp. Obi]|nr:hypothetical protein COCOBI_03-1900 [Coccomyxa sp. Obi]